MSTDLLWSDIEINSLDVFQEVKKKIKEKEKKKSNLELFKEELKRCFVLFPSLRCLFG